MFAGMFYMSDCVCVIFFQNSILTQLLGFKFPVAKQIHTQKEEEEESENFR